jgi:hypothetical protein
MPAPELDREHRLDEVLADYLKAAQAGSAPSRRELLDSHPDLADELAAFFADQERFQRMATPLRGLTVAPFTPGKPRDFGDYEILEEISRGGMGVVYKARQKSLRRLVALKLLLAGPFAAPGELLRFRAEAEAVAALDHPHIVPLYEVGSQDGRPYLSMKLLSGGSLAQATRDRPLPTRAAAQLLAQVADAVHYAHQRGILHRDLKPANILLDEAEQPYVSDFGLAKREGGRGRGGDGGSMTPAQLTQTGAILGTPGYMAPEQAAGRRGAVTVAADVYGLGAILYELLTGRPPFKGETPLDTLRQVLDCTPPRPSALRPDVDRDLETICLKCLAREPARRYASAEALADDLRRWLQGRPIQARPAGLLTRLRLWALRQPVVAALATALTAALLIGFTIVFLLWRKAEHNFDVAEARRLEAEELSRKAVFHAEEAEKHRLNALHNADQAEHNRREAEHRRIEAEDGFQLAHQAVNQFVLQYSDALDESPGLQRVGKTLLESSLAYYQRFLQMRGDDPLLKAEMAETHFRIARLTQRIGRKADALAAFRRSEALYRELYEADPTDAAAQYRLATLPNNIAPLMERNEDALAVYEQARSLFERFLRDRPDDANLLGGLASTLNNMAARQHWMGRTDLALCLCHQAQAIQERELDRHHGNLEWVHDLALTLNNLSSLQSLQPGGLEEALRLATRVVALHERRVKDKPLDPLRQSELASALYNQAVALDQVGQHDEALKTFTRCREKRERLARENSDVPRFQGEWANSLLSQGQLQLSDGHPEDALNTFQQTRDIFNKLNRLDPQDHWYRKEMARTDFQAAQALRALKRPAESILKPLQWAAETQRGLLKEDAATPDLHYDLAHTLNLMVVVLANQGKKDEALRLVEEGLEHARLAFAAGPQVWNYRWTLDGLCDSWGQLERMRGQADRAATAALERRRMWAGDPRELYRVARDLALVAAVVGKGKTELSEEEQKARAEYLDLVVQTLTEAVDCGYRDLKRLLTDRDLNAVRDRADFQALLTRLGPGVPVGPPEPPGEG